MAQCSDCVFGHPFPVSETNEAGKGTGSGRNTLNGGQLDQSVGILAALRALGIGTVAGHAEGAGLGVAVVGHLDLASADVFGAQVAFGDAAVDVVPRQRRRRVART